MLRKLFSLIVASSFFSSCVTTIPLSSNYFDSNKKTGVVLNVKKISKMRQGSQGLLDLAMTSGDKYKEPLETIEPKLRAIEKYKSCYETIYSAKNKQVTFVDAQSIDVKQFPKFEKPKDSKGKKYFAYDLRSLKSKLGVDELLFSTIDYGIMVSYYSMIETGKNGNAIINSAIINLDDNSLVYSNSSSSLTIIDGKWKTPPAYESLQKSIEQAIDNSILAEKNKFLQ